MKAIDFVREWNRNAKAGRTILEFALANDMTRSQALSMYKKWDKRLGINKKTGNPFLIHIPDNAANRLNEGAILRQFANEQFRKSLQEGFQSKISHPTTSGKQYVDKHGSGSGKRVGLEKGGRISNIDAMERAARGY